MHELILRSESGQERPIGENDRYTIVHCLRVAADHFDENAKICTEEKQPGLAEQFTLQAADARRIADEIED